MKTGSNLFPCFLLIFAKFARLKGSMAEWLGRGLQNLLRRFESAWNLKSLISLKSGFFVIALIKFQNFKLWKRLRERD